MFTTTQNTYAVYSCVSINYMLQSLELDPVDILVFTAFTTLYFSTVHLKTMHCTLVDVCLSSQQ